MENIANNYNNLIKNFIPMFGNPAHIKANRLIAKISVLEQKLKEIKKEDAVAKSIVEIIFLKRNVIFCLTKE